MKKDQQKNTDKRESKENDLRKKEGESQDKFRKEQTHKKHDDHRR